MSRLSILSLLLVVLGACATPDPYTTPISQDQAVVIARQKVEQEEHWGSTADLMRVVHDQRGWHVWLSKYSVGPNGEHLSPVDAWDRYITINDYGRVTHYSGAF